MCYSIREAGEGEAEKIYSLMKKVYEGIEDKSTFICDGLDVVKKHLSPPHFGLVAEGDDGHLAASVFTRVPGEDDDNLGLEIPLSGAELYKVIHIESVVVNVSDRGHSLERRLIAECLQRLLGTPYTYVMATVHPDNTPSLKSFMRNGFETVVVKKKYNGYIRAVLLKEI